MISIAGVRFRNAGRVYYFDPKDFALTVGNHVIVETARGPEYGIVTARVRQVEDDMVSLPLRSVIRIATEEDDRKIREYRAKEREALAICREKVRKHKLNMKMVNAEYSFEGNKILFYFTADGRIDFRDLVKDLASVFRMRIELRQIGVRDETRMLGGLGCCGRELCCATYLSDFVPVSIKMAKEQNLSLNPAKISGVCGRLLCCLKNEEDTYEELNANMPRVGEEAITSDGIVGKVIEVNVLRQRCRVLFEEGDSKEIQEFGVTELTFRPHRRKGEKSQDGAPGSGDSFETSENPKRRKTEGGTEEQREAGRRGSEKKRFDRSGSVETGPDDSPEEGAEPGLSGESGFSADGKPRQEKSPRKASGKGRRGKGGGEKAAGAPEEGDKPRSGRQRKGEAGRGGQREEDGRRSGRPDRPEKSRGEGQKKQRPQNERGKRPNQEGAGKENAQGTLPEDGTAPQAKRPRRRRPKKGGDERERSLPEKEGAEKRSDRPKEKAGGGRGPSGAAPSDRSAESQPPQAGTERSHEMSIYAKKS